MCSLSQPPTKRRRLDFTESITVIVGSKKQKFEVQKTYLIKSSDFFRTCCNASWSEATTRTIDMSETEPDYFGMYLQWLYTGELVLDEHTEEEVKELEHTDRNEIGGLRYHAIFHLAILGEYIQDTAFSNAVVDAFIKTEDATSLGPSCVGVKRYYTQLSNKLTLRRVLVDWYVAAANQSVFKDAKDELPRDLIWDVMLRCHTTYRAGTRVKILSWKIRCDYHEHEQGVSRCA